MKKVERKQKKKRLFNKGLLNIRYYTVTETKGVESLKKEKTITSVTALERGQSQNISKDKKLLGLANEV